MFSKFTSGLGISKVIAKRFTLILLLLTFFMGSFAFAEKTAAKDTKKRYLSHPHCGLYCLYSIMKLEGLEIDFRDLVKPEYLGSSEGSSVEELMQAVEDFGLHSVSLSRLTLKDLKGISEPTIMHVKSIF